MIKIRVERAQDNPDVRVINEKAFGGSAEADVVDTLRQACSDHLSLVAEAGGRLAGHILFTPAVVEGSGIRIEGVVLAPLAVLPGCRRQGIGSALVRRGVEILRQRECPFVIVVGHPEYYPRFGFEVASKHGLSFQWEGVPNEAFMVLILDDGVMSGVSGVARILPEWSEAA